MSDARSVLSPATLLPLVALAAGAVWAPPMKFPTRRDARGTEH